MIFFIYIKKNIDISPYIYTIRLNENKINISRDQLIKQLEKKKISAVVHYIPTNKLNFYKSKMKFPLLKNTLKTFQNIISLPFHNKLSKKEVDYVCNHIEKIIIKNSKN